VTFHSSLVAPFAFLCIFFLESDEFLQFKMNPSLISKAAAPARVLAQNAPKIQCLKKGAQLHTAAWRAGSQNQSSLRKRTRAPSAKRVSRPIPIDKVLHSDM